MEELLKERIAREGLITYETFVATALYDERFGYYKSGKEDLKDYHTSPEIHAAFGRTLARYAEDIRIRSGVPSLTIVELGGASGRLARDFLSASERPPECYFIVEKGPERQEGPIRWISTVEHMGHLSGLTVVVANEFFDALPFHRIINRDRSLEEIYVGYDRGFFEEPGPLSAGLAVFLDRYPVLLPPGRTIEVTPSGLPILEKLTALLELACLIVFDYGYHGSDIEEGRFPDGSIVGYRARRIGIDVFSILGGADITHHVNFDHLTAMLEFQGWKKEGETEQYRFLFNAGIGNEMAGLSDKERLSAKWLINPEGLGSMITVLGFSKGLPAPLPAFGKA